MKASPEKRTDSIEPLPPSSVTRASLLQRIIATARNLATVARRRWYTPEDFLQWKIESERLSYDEQIRLARARGDKDEAEALIHEARFEVGELQVERDLAITRKYVNQADRLFVGIPPIPQRTEEIEPADKHWRWEDRIGRWVLTPDGVSIVRAAIRDENKQRREASSSRIGLLIGLGGTAIGVINALVILLKALAEKN